MKKLDLEIKSTGYQAEFRRVADEIMKQLGVPSLRMEGDGWDSRFTSIAVIQEQLSDFFETLA